MTTEQILLTWAEFVLNSTTHVNVLPGLSPLPVAFNQAKSFFLLKAVSFSSLSPSPKLGSLSWACHDAAAS